MKIDVDVGAADADAASLRWPGGMVFAPNTTAFNMMARDCLCSCFFLLDYSSDLSPDVAKLGGEFALAWWDEWLVRCVG